MQVLYTGGVKSGSKKGVVLEGDSIWIVKWNLWNHKLYVIGLVNCILLYNSESVQFWTNVNIELLCNSDILHYATLDYDSRDNKTLKIAWMTLFFHHG